MAVAGKILYSGAIGTSAAGYTVPSATTTRVTHIKFSGDGTGDTITATITDSSESTTTNIINSEEIAANTGRDEFDFYLEAGDSIEFSATTGSHVDVTVMGQELS